MSRRAEEDLVEAAQRGDRAALDQLLRDHYDRIWAVCRRIAGNDADAADATQEALIAVVKGLARYDGRAAFGTWSYRVATNACLDELRRRKRRPVPGLPDVERSAAGSAPDPASTVAGQAFVDDALSHLSPEFRAAVALRDLCDLDYATIADILDIPPGTVRSWIARGRAALADRLSGNPEDTPVRPSERS